MTPLKAIEQIHAVKFVASTRYPINTVCAHPECDSTDITRHHIFGRGKGENSDSWFVLLPLNSGWREDEEHPLNDRYLAKKAIPHVVGLCGDGVKGHHGAVEAHDAWIKYEDGVFVWYDRVSHYPPPTDEHSHPEEWVRVGALDPQPFDWGSKAKKPKPRKTGEARATRTRISVAVPTGFAEGGKVWDEHFGKEDGWVRQALGILREEEDKFDKRPPFELIVDALHDWRLRLQEEGIL